MNARNVMTDNSPDLEIQSSVPAEDLGEYMVELLTEIRTMAEQSMLLRTERSLRCAISVLRKEAPSLFN